MARVKTIKVARVIKSGRRKPRVANKKAVTSLVKRVVTRMAEKKQVNYAQRQSFGGGNYVGFSANNVFPITPYATFMDVTQGAFQNQRIGNSIRVQKLLFKALLFPLPYDLTTNPTPGPTEVRLWFFSPRYSTTTPVSYSTFFQNGGTSSGFTSTVTDMNKYINEDLYIYRGHRTFKLGFANYQGTGSNAQYQYQANNDFKMNHKVTIDCTKMVGKIFEWNDNTSATLTNKAVFCVMEAVYADGRATSTTDILAAIDWSLQLEYTDP